ncbi:hypothetical protein ACE6HT_13030 [Citrobacter freundii]|uniref:hypothetical protein n=1 Tax=Citrobacter freundii TaxID=546 RepID=UPI0035D1341B
MKPTYEELELQLEESQREFRAADVTIHNLELKITDMAVQLANAESKCRELTAENAGLKNPENWLSQSDYGYEASEVATQNGATEDESLRAGMIAIINRIGTPATDAFLAEVRASAIDNLVDIKTKQLADMHPDTHAFGATAMSIRSQINELQSFAAQLRKGAAL